jgi:hypothetical protein
MFGMGVVELLVLLMIALIIFGLPLATLIVVVVAMSKKRRD